MSEKKFLKLVGKRIASLRKQKGFTQIDLAYSCNFEKSNMSRIENGNTNPTISTLFKIAQVLHVEVKDLLEV